jgi:hypothetical protein
MTGVTCLAGQGLYAGADAASGTQWLRLDTGHVSMDNEAREHKRSKLGPSGVNDILRSERRELERRYRRRAVRIDRKTGHTMGRGQS